MDGARSICGTDRQQWTAVGLIDKKDGCGLIEKKGRRAAGLLCLLLDAAAHYVVGRGLTAMAVAGTMAVAGLGPE
jgi:hypothetical protein